MQAGDLVMMNNEVGIVIGVSGNNCEVMLGNSLREVLEIDQLKLVFFDQKLQAGITASFPELVKAFITLRGYK